MVDGVVGPLDVGRQLLIGLGLDAGGQFLAGPFRNRRMVPFDVAWVTFGVRQIMSSALG